MSEELDLQKLNSQDLGKPEIIEQVKEEIEQQKLTRAVDLVYKFLQQLKTKLAELSDDQAEIKEKYHVFILELEWLSFSMLGEAEAKGLIKTDLLRVFSWLDYDLHQAVDEYLLARVPILFRDRVKKEFINSLKQSEEKIGNQEIEDQNGKMVSSTIANWLKEYDLVVGSNLADKLKKTEFLYQSKNSRLLTETERQNLIKLVDFYEFLKRTSEHPEGVEEKFIIQDEDRLVEVDHGKVIELGPLPEVVEKEKDLSKIHIREPHIGEFLEKEDTADTHLEEVKPEIKKKIIKPVKNNNFVAPTLKEAEAVMQKPKIKNPKAKVESKIEIPEPKPKPAPKPQIKKPMPITPQPISKPSIADVKAPQKVLSLTDELEQLTLDEFRKLGADKIREKIDLLEQDSMEKRAEGIGAWRKSPVNSLYLEIGQDSFMQGKGVREVIKSREESGQPVLTYAEFEDLADLNKSLRF